jgi:hypothetical protein
MHLGPHLDKLMLCTCALEIMETDPSWCPFVFELLMKAFQSAGEHGYVHIAYVDYLARHGYRIPEVIDRLVRYETVSDTIIKLALEHAPDLLPDVLRRGLRSDSGSITRTAAAAVMARLDNDWSRRELAAVLADSTSPPETIECRLALRESRDPQMRQLVDEWESRHLDSEDEADSARIFQDKLLAAEKVLAKLRLPPDTWQ